MKVHLKAEDTLQSFQFRMLEAIFLPITTSQTVIMVTMAFII